MDMQYFPVSHLSPQRSRERGVRRRGNLQMIANCDFRIRTNCPVSNQNQLRSSIFSTKKDEQGVALTLAGEVLLTHYFGFYLENTPRKSRFYDTVLSSAKLKEKNPFLFGLLSYFHLYSFQIQCIEKGVIWEELAYY